MTDPSFNGASHALKVSACELCLQSSLCLLFLYLYRQVPCLPPHDGNTAVLKTVGTTIDLIGNSPETFFPDIQEVSRQSSNGAL